MIRSSCVITKSTPELVAPSDATPPGTLALSAMDRTTVVRILVDLVLVFKQGRGRGTHDRPAAEAIKSAMASALVHYYPVAGRIKESKAGEAEVACTGEGVWFVEASASCRLEDVNDLERPLMVHKTELLPLAPPDVIQEDLIFMMQVTQFECGGFAVGITFSHTVFDGIGAGQFLKAIGEMARGHARPAVQPVWSREDIPRPPKPKLSKLQGRHDHQHNHPSPSINAAFRFETCVTDVSLGRVNAIKNQFASETGHKCTTFDVVTAVVWRCRTRAINSEPDAVVHLGFAANTRHLLHQVLPKEGFYGNCVFPMGIGANGRAVADGSIVEVVKLIRDAKERLPGRFLDWMRGRADQEDPYKVPLDYGTLVVSDWSRVGFGEVDCGWGQPMHVAPLNDDCNFVASSIYLRPSGNKMQGLRLMCRCVEASHLEAFCAEMMNFA